MKKFTLLLAAALISFSGAAQTFKRMSDTGIKAKHSEMLTHKNVMNLPMSVNNETIIKDQAVLNKLKAATKRAADEAGYTEIPSLYSGALYCDYSGFMCNICMRQGGVVEDGNDLYAAYLGGYFKGTRIAGPNQLQNIYLQNGSDLVVDSVTFDNNQIVLTDGGVNYYVRVTGDDLTASSAQSFGAYYIPETHELYIPELLGLYEGESEFPESYTVMANIDFMPAESFLNEYVAKVTLDDPEENYTFNNDTTARAIIADFGNIYVQGLDDMDPTAWLELTMTSSNGEAVDGANLAIGQYINTFNMRSGDGTRYILDLYTMPNVGPGGGYNGVMDGLDFFMEDGEDGSLVLESDGLAYYGLYGYGQNEVTEEEAGAFLISAWPNVKIEITPNSTAIKGVTDNMGEVSSKEYFDISGRKVAGNAKGLVIEKTRYANGKTVSRKVLK